MSDLAIVARDVGKEYRIGATQVQYNTLRDALASWRQSLRSSIRSPAGGHRHERFQALTGVSFELRSGEVLGVIGRNGAGKSTLLKILSRITEPTTGEIAIRGRVGALLEVGTGFHSELSGRENIFLNGAILGMSRAEIARKFDEIVAFAEVERFIDTPVKHYSSGMHLRLGFAVAAHLEPEILVVDEVLAVGDAAFQTKCIKKMESVAGEGRTVIFVSHNLDAVRRLCTRCLLLDGGVLTADGPTDDVTSQYSAGAVRMSGADQWHDISRISRRESGELRLTAIHYRGVGARDVRVHSGGPVDVTLQVTARTAATARCLSLMVFDVHGIRLVNAEIAALDRQLEFVPGNNFVRVSVAELHLNPGRYVLGCWIAADVEDAEPMDFVEAAAGLEVVGNDIADSRYPWASGPVACRYTIEGVSGAAVPTLPSPASESSG